MVTTMVILILCCLSDEEASTEGWQCPVSERQFARRLIEPVSLPATRRDYWDLCLLSILLGKGRHCYRFGKRPESTLDGHSPDILVCLFEHLKMPTTAPSSMFCGGNEKS